MENADLPFLLSAEGLRLLDDLPPYDRQADVLRAVSRLRQAGHSPGMVAAVLSQSKLRASARRKFGEFAERMLFTSDGLEQATRLSVAAHHAARYRDAGLARVADLGCGIGADALALASLDREVLAVERDEPTAAFAAYNLAPWPNARVELAEAQSVDLGDIDAVFADPARRGTGRRGPRRLADPGEWSPPLDWVFGLATERPIGVKLGPAIDHELLPDDAETQWVTVDGETVEAAVWTGALARPGVRRAALVLGAGGAAEMTAAGDSADEDVRPLGDVLYEPHGAVIRARLIGDLARGLGAAPFSPGIAYLSADEFTPTPFARGFRVLERLPLGAKALQKALAARDIGTLEIKKRGVDIDPAEFRRRLRPQGPNAATLVLTRIDGEHAALLVERLD